MLPDWPPRPRYHFTPPANWMNDPNGLVYDRRAYHLFYQYHPGSATWGPMHWGHAVSRDLVNWEHLPVALHPDEHGAIFSGSAVIDWHNTAGFGAGAMVAVFTHDRPGVQSQSLAYSLDAGRTWTKYPANPVLSPPAHLHDFRDPRVFWYGPPQAGHWVMALAAHDTILFYTSPDLIHWTARASFGPGLGAARCVWETPDLFELPVAGTPETRWVLTVGVQCGGPAGGSATQYFIGAFDGAAFTSENPPETVLWADFGADYYAAQSWNDAPQGRCLMLAWQNNWQYANLIPAAGWRGALSLPRELSLSHTADGLRLVQQPIPELQSLRHAHHHWQDETILPGSNLLANIHSQACELIAEFQVDRSAERFGFRLRVGAQEATTVGYHVREAKLYVDRAQSGQVDFHPGFAACHQAHLALAADTLRLQLFVDRTSLEVFANDGLLVFSESIFPSEHSQGLELFSAGGPVTLKSLDLYQLAPASFSPGS